MKNFIDGYTHPENFRATYIYAGKILSVYRKSVLSELMSEICSRVYSRTPIINNEVINKNEITSMALNSRSKIIAALLHQELESNLGLRGTGQDVSIMLSALIRTGVLIGDNNPRITLRPENKDMRNLLETIENFILETRQNPTSFSVLYERLISPSGQIGLRRGVIPIYLATVIHNYKQQITISNRFGTVRTSVDTLIQINSAPEDFLIEYLDWSADNSNFVSSLANVFEDFVVVAEKNLGSCDYVSNAMIRWFLSLPKYTKEFKSSPNGSKILKTSTENFRGNETSERQIIFVDDTGEKNIKRFEPVELSARGKLLFNQITASLEAMGQAVSLQEKRQVLTEILRTLC